MPNNDNHFATLAFSTDLTKIESLLISGVNPNITDDMGQTPLHQELSQGNINEGKVTLLLQHGADLKIQDHFKKTSLHTVIEKQNIDSIKLLLQYGQNITPIEKKELVKALLQNSNNKNSLQSLAFKELFSLNANDYKFESDNIILKTCSDNKELNITFDMYTNQTTSYWSETAEQDLAAKLTGEVA